MHRPVFGASTIKDEKVYKIDHETTEADGEAETAQMSAASPPGADVSVDVEVDLAEGAAPDTRPTGERVERHPFSQTLPLLPRR